MPRSLLLALIAAVGLAGCGADAPDQAPAGSTPAAEPATSVRAATTTTTTTTAPSAATGPTTAPRITTPPPARTSARGPRVSVLATGLVVPWDIAFLPDGRALMTERPGRVRLIERNRRVRRAPVAQIAGVAARGEGGLLGVAVDPGFAQGRRNVYLYLTTARGMELRRYRWQGGRLVSPRVVLDGIAAGSIHDSGRIRFGPDRRLYVATGDAGSGGRAQQRRSLNGKILRLTPGQYRSSVNRPEQFSIGHRNPQGLAWQPRSNRLVTTDHGPSGFDGPSGNDEVNVVRRGSNHGWPVVRGRNHGRFAAPARLYGTTIAPSGIAFLTKPSAWRGQAVVAALKGQTLRRLRFDGARVVRDVPLLAGRFGRLRAAVEAPDGSLWVTTSNRDMYGSAREGDDRLLRIVPPRR